MILNWRNLATGLFIFFLGLFKKVIVADTFAKWANAGFDSDQALTFLEAWGASLSYTFQLYYDFSAYSDMAIGAALMLNIRLPINFNSPYKATNIREFWQRWHITLSRWLRDYVYIPLGGNQKGKYRMLENLMITFLLGGIWHGAAWTFVFWGALHGLAMIVHRIWHMAGFWMPRVLGCFVTFIFVNFSWVFFRANSFSDAQRVLEGMAGLNGLTGSREISTTLSWTAKVPFGSSIDATSYLLGIWPLCWIAVFAMVAFIMPNTVQMAHFVPYKGVFGFRVERRYAFASGIVAALASTWMLLSEGTEFLYFNF